MFSLLIQIWLYFELWVLKSNVTVHQIFKHKPKYNKLIFETDYSSNYNFLRLWPWLQLDIVFFFSNSLLSHKQEGRKLICVICVLSIFQYIILAFLLIYHQQQLLHYEYILSKMCSFKKTFKTAEGLINSN